MSASRAVGVTYTNNTGKPIQLNISFAIKNGNVIRLYIDGVDIAVFSGSSPTEYDYNMWNNIIPDGSTYRVAYTTGTGVLNRWFELREVV